MNGNMKHPSHQTKSDEESARQCFVEVVLLLGAINGVSVWGGVCVLQPKCFAGKKQGRKQTDSSLQWVLPKKKFVIQAGSRTACELREPLHSANTNELASPHGPSARGAERRGAEPRVCLKEIRAGSPAVC